jgi:hypothetical protein
MKTLRIPMTAALATALAVGAALAQSATGSSGTEARGSATSETQSAASGGAARVDAQVSADAKASADAALRKQIEEKGARAKAEDRGKMEAQLDADALETEHAASAQGDARIVARMAQEFGLTSDELMAEKSALSTSWGNLIIAHSIAANSKTDITVATLIGMKHDGMGWGQIAAGLDLNLGSVVSAVKTEGRVAAGIGRPDGKVASMRGLGARVDVAGGNAGLHAGVGHGAAGAAGRGVGLGAGVKIKP